MYREKLVVATDLSQKSEMALDKAIELAKRYDKWLEVVHVVNTGMFDWLFKGLGMDEKKMEEERAKRLQKISDDIKEKLSRRHDKLNIDVRYGNPAKEVINYCVEKEGTIIFVGNTGEYHDAEKLLLGTTVKRIIDNSPVPILLAKNNRSSKYKNIFIPIDLTENSLKCIEFSAYLFEEAKITLYYVYETASEFRLRYYGIKEEEIAGMIADQKNMAEEEVREFVDRIECKNRVEVIIDKGSMSSESIVNKAKESGADIISLSAYKINDVASKLIGNIASDVMEQSSVDVLVLGTSETT